MEKEAYQRWIPMEEPAGTDLSLMRELLETFAYLPKISVLMAVSDPDEIWMKRSRASLESQVYPHFELCVCDNASHRPHVAEALEEFMAADERLKTNRLQEPASQAETYNRALSLATGEFVVLLDAGDELAPEALFSLVEALQNTAVDIAYADEDAVDIFDRRSDPVFKPYWSPDLLLSTMYAGRPCFIRRDLVNRVGRFREGFEGAEEQDLLLRASESAEHIQHVPRMLYHRRFYGEEPAIYVDERASTNRAVKEALDRRLGSDAVSKVRLEPGPAPGSVRVMRDLAGDPVVSVITLGNTTPDAGDFGKQPNYTLDEIISANSGESAIRVNVASPARMLNLAAGKATGDYLLFLQDYREAGSQNWVSALLREAQRPEAGLVCGKLLDSEGEARCAGGFVDLGQLGGPLLRELPAPDNLPLVSRHVFNPYAVCGGCMMIRRSLFEGVGGFDEDNLPGTFYDLDLSFRLREQGFLNVYTPDANIVSGWERPRAGVEELAYLWERWWPMLVKALHYERQPPLAAYEGYYDAFLASV
ncbi:MAG: glycosyltransferase [Rubrobacteraceae bacterium]